MILIGYAHTYLYEKKIKNKKQKTKNKIYQCKCINILDYYKNYVFDDAIHKYLKTENTCTNVHTFSEILVD